MVQANTGLRIGDLLNLRLKDIIKESGRYHFNIKEEKTKKPRTFTIAPEVYTYLQSYALENGIKPTAKLFDISSRGISKHLKTTAEYLGYEGNRQILRRIDRHERIVVGRTGKSREVPLLLLQGRQER